MEVESKVRRTFLSGIALCVVSCLLLVLGAIGVQSFNTDTYIQYFVMPSVFIGVGIIAIVTSRRNKKLIPRTKLKH
jgi:hypothetical protein